MKVTYYNHSGFSVETENKVLIFDYYSQGGRFNFFEPKDYMGKQIIFFVSHSHDDHLDTRIFLWKDKASYVVSSDVRVPLDVQSETLVVKPNQTYSFQDMRIETLKSNDEGVAFLVEVDGKTIYHAGDLNWWHWNGEGDDFNDGIAKSYHTEIEKIAGRKIDVAFVPADLRLEDKYCWATDYFMQEVGAKVVFPMHFWGKFQACSMLQEKNYGDKVMNITKENQRFMI